MFFKVAVPEISLKIAKVDLKFDLNLKNLFLFEKILFTEKIEGIH